MKAITKIFETIGIMIISFFLSFFINLAVYGVRSYFINGSGILDDFGPEGSTTVSQPMFVFWIIFVITFVCICIAFFSSKKDKKES